MVLYSTVVCQDLYDEEDEYEFEDPDGLLLILDKAIQLVHQLT